MTTLLCVAGAPAGMKCVAKAVGVGAFGARMPTGRAPNRPGHHKLLSSSSAFLPLHASASGLKDSERAQSGQNATDSPLETAKQSHAKPRPTGLEELTKAIVGKASDVTSSDVHVLRTRRPASIKSEEDSLSAKLEQILSAWSITTEEWLAVRHALNATSWPDIRICMRSIADCAWPSVVLAHGVSLVTSASEASDALAVLKSNVRQIRSTSDELLQAHRQAFQSLMNVALTDYGALDLVPRFSQVFYDLAAVKALPLNPGQINFVLTYAFDLTRHADERTREAMLYLLNLFSSDEQDGQTTSLHQSIVRTCLANERLGERGRGSSRSRSTRMFCSGPFIDELICRIPLQDRKTRRWAHRVAIAVAGRERNPRKVTVLYDELLSLRENPSVVEVSDLLLYAKALSRTVGGHKDALRAANQAGLAYSFESPPVGFERRPIDVYLDILEIVSKNRFVSANTVLSLINVTAHNTSEVRTLSLPPNILASAGNALAEPAAYAFVFQGLIRRGDSVLVPKIWRIMLDRKVAPTIATLSLLLQALFKMGDVHAAMQQLNIWLEEGAVIRKATTQGQEPETVAIDLTTSDLVRELEVETCRNTAIPPGSQKVLLAPDSILASVVFKGLSQLGANGMESLWTAFSETISRFPDSAILSLLLRLSCRHKDASLTLQPSLMRELFKALLFTKHPELQEYQNPLCIELGSSTGSWLLCGESPEHKLGRWFSSIFTETSSKPAPKVHNTDKLVFNTQVFDSYVRLLLHLHHRSQFLSSSNAIRGELIDTLGWLKELNIRPAPSTIALVVLELEEGFPPPLASSQMAKIDNWLVDWLGPERLPSEEQMKQFWRWKMERNERATGWFDPVFSSEMPETLEMPGLAFGRS